jgi:single-stranded-DNA-specific exonuclease
MNQILIDYIKRYKTNSSQNLDKFHTQLDLDEYISKLPYLYGVPQFCVRMLVALQNQEKICIYSDYDTDAVTATATMYWGLIALGFLAENLDFYAPDRFTEGYGMNTLAVYDLALKYDLIISVDCGINSTKEAEVVNQLKTQPLSNNFRKNTYCDLIITDHHHLQADIPECVAVLNPRLAEYYFHNPKKLIQPLGHTQIADTNLKSNADAWLTKMNRDPQEFSTAPAGFLSSSVTGVGVAWFAVVWLGYFLSESGLISIKISNLNKLLPLVAIGTVADCQSILEPTNRVMVKAGLRILNDKSPSVKGLEAMLNHLGFQQKITDGYQLTSQDLGYVLSPILNSSGRLSHAKLSIKTLLGENNAQNIEDIVQLVQTNEDRKKMVKDFLGEVESGAKAQFAAGEKLIWLEGNWSKGIVGLLASRLVNQYNVPVVVIADEEDSEVVSASLRAPEGYHLPNAILAMGDLLIKGGGHPGAAGFSAKKIDLEPLRMEFTKAITAQSAQNILDKPIFAPAETESKIRSNIAFTQQFSTLKYRKNLIWVDASELNVELLNQVFILDPYGQDFPMPSFVVQLSITSANYKWLGQEQKHIKITLDTGITATVFNLKNDFKEMLLKDTGVSTKTIWTELKMSQNTWNGKTSLELIAENIWV